MANRKTSIKLIEKAVSEGWIRQLAFYHQLKFKFNNSCIYDYRSRMNEIAGQFNISTKTFYNYLNVLRQKELACDHSTNLRLESIKKFGSHKKVIILIRDDHTIFDVTCLLYLKLIEQKAKQQAFCESVRRFGAGDKSLYKTCEAPFRPSFSLRTIAKICNISLQTTILVIKNLNRLEVIKSEKQKPQLIADNFTAIETVEDLPGYRYNIGNKLFQNFGQRIDFLQFPVYLKNISLKQFIAYKKHITV